MLNANKRKMFFFILFILIISLFFVSLFVIRPWNNNSALLFIPIIDYNKIKTVKDTQIINPDTMQKAYIASLCNSLKKESNSTITQTGTSTPVCKDQDNMSLYKSGMATSYNPTEVTMYNPDGSKYNVPKGCNWLKDSCLENGGDYLNEAYCDVSKQVVALKEVKCPSGYLCKYGACIEKKCGDGFVKDGEECDDGNNKDGDGCDSKCKIEKQEVDLYVGEVKDTVKSENCLNYVLFKICNGGNGKVTSSFKIQVSAENKGTIILLNYDVGKYGPIGGNSCVEINEPQKLNVFAFFAGLYENLSLKIGLDTNFEIEETDETNNSITKTVYTGDAYILDENVSCKLTCYDPDGGFLYPAPFEYSKAVLKGNNLEVLEDSCNWNNMALNESYCKLSSGEFMLKQKYVPCYAIDKKCEDGKCVELEAGESTTNLDCDDSSPGNVKKFGEVIFSDLKGDEHILQDYCSFLFLKEDYSCNGVIPDQYPSGCYDGICVDGGCVTAEKKFECDVDTNVVDFYDAKAVTGTNIYTYDGKDYFSKVSEIDYCAGTTLSEAICGNSGIEYIKYDCNLDGLVCDWGACVTPQPEIKDCSDVGDNGLDPFIPGEVKYYKGQISYTESDICLDPTTLVETYCVDTNFEAATIDCKIYGDNYFCVEDSKEDGACVEKNPDLQKCVDNGWYIQYTDWFGQTKPFEKKCNCNFEAVSYYCVDDKTMGEKKTNCVGSEKCIVDSCVAPNPSLESCNQLSTSVHYTDIYGVKTVYLNGCNTEFGAPQATKYVCNGNKYDTIEDACEPGQVCNSTFGICMAPVDPACKDWDDKNYFKKSLTISNDEFGINEVYADFCSSVYLKERICKTNKADTDKVKCTEILNDENATCYDGICTKYDQKKEFCDGPSSPEEGKMSSGQIIYGDGYEIYNNPQNECKTSSISVWFDDVVTKQDISPKYSMYTDYCEGDTKKSDTEYCIDSVCGSDVKEVNGKKEYISDLCIDKLDLYADKYVALSITGGLLENFEFYLNFSNPIKEYTEQAASSLMEEYIKYVYFDSTNLLELDKNMTVCVIAFYPESIDPEEYDLLDNVVINLKEWYVLYNQELEEIMAGNGVEVCYINKYNVKFW